MLPAALAAESVRRERFEREARNISRLEHPHICPLYDVGEHEGHAYLVMRFLDGETLAERLARGPLTVSSDARLRHPDRRGVGRGHRAGIVHRDLKPRSVTLTKTGARLLDFGLARTVPGQTSLQTTAGGRSLATRQCTESRATHPAGVDRCCLAVNPFR